MLIHDMGCLRIISTTFLLFMLWYSDSAIAATLGNGTDRFSLLAIKAQITDDPLQVLSSWNSSINFCEWKGVTCSLRHHQRVTSLNLSGNSLVGSISPHIGNLSFLKVIDLHNNSLHGTIPENIGRLFRLKYLKLKKNNFEGKIPSNLTHCSELTYLNLSNNYLTGNLPTELGSLSKLVSLTLDNNNLSGGIPSSFGNLSSLQLIFVQYNSLEGSIPDTFGRILSLNVLAFADNRLSGRIPPSVYNLSSIKYISLAYNQLEGSLPPDIGITLPNLQKLYIAQNKFSGSIPFSLPNASQLEGIDISQNYFTGEVPSNLGQLNLRVLRIAQTRLGSEITNDMSLIITSLTNCTRLEKLGLDHNNFVGVLPNSVSNLSTKLIWAYFGGNRLSGSIPPGIGNLASLNTLGLDSNLFSGSIPPSFGKLQNLQRLYLNENRLTGKIPSSLGNMSLLSDLYLHRNSLEGSIPGGLGNCKNLQKLNLSMNNLNGSIPEQFIGLNNQPFDVDLSHNSLTGSLPAQIGNLRNLQYLYVSDNALSGEIPSSLTNCLRLEVLYLNRNNFRGEIPTSWISLNGLRELDLSSNNFSGRIPTYLEGLPSLQILNLSFNDFEGEVPIKGVFRNASAVSLVGNEKICGGISALHLPRCPTKMSAKHRKSGSPKLVIAMISVVMFLVISLSVFYCYRRQKPRKQPSPIPSVGEKHFMVSYKDLHQATNGFSLMNLIGSGSFGHVYKGTLSQYASDVAVKVFNHHREGISKIFLAECEALRNIRHRNLVKTLTSCSSVDADGNDFKALVFEFMPKGSLEKWLHPDADSEQCHSSFNLIQKLNIAIDIASALDYLHHQCHIQIVHCDLKPSNVLLDDDMIAHVGDFGLARLLSKTIKNFSMTQTSSIGIKGSIGYVAPEYGMGGEASTQGDVYSFGILLLEMFLGKKPTDEMFQDGLNLHKFASAALTERASERVYLVHADEEIQPEEDKINLEHSSSNRDFMQECQAAMIRTGVACSVEPPGERMNMDDVTRELGSIRHTFLAAMGRG